MKKVQLVIFMALFISLSLNSFKGISQDTSVKVLRSNAQETLLAYKLPEYKLSKKEADQRNFFNINISGFYPAMEAGNPELPVLRQMMSVPAGAEVEVLLLNPVYQQIDLEEKGIQEKMIPHQPTQFKDQPPRDFVINQKVYELDEYYGLETATVDYLGIARDVAVARLNIAPFRYNPVSNTLRVLTSAQIKVQLTAKDQSRQSMLEQKGGSSYFMPPVDIIAFESLNAKDSISTTPAKYVIVADSMFRSSLQPLVKWKTQKGFQVVEAYTSDPAVGSTTNSIKSYLQSHYDNATPSNPAPGFVLLVGDVAELPAFYGNTGSHPTDMFYVEYSGDYIPDAYVGRFSASDTSELQIQVNKTITYEKYLMPQPSYLDQAVLIAGADGTFGPVHANGQVNYIHNEYINNAAGFSSNVYLYPNSSSNASQIKQDLSNGFGIANYTAHGLSYGWSDPQLYVNDLNSIQNVGQYGLMIGNACLTNKFDEPTCFGEAVLQLDNRGAIGYIGGSNNTLWDEDFYWSVGVTANITASPVYAMTGAATYDKLFHTHGEPFSQWYTTQGQMLFSGNWAVELSNSSNNEYYWEIYHLMGDPSLMPYLGTPDVPVVSHVSILPLGASQLQVNAEPYATVALSMNDSLIAVDMASQSGSALLDFQPLSDTGTALLVVTAQNYQPYIDSIQVVSPNGPYIAHYQVDINDSLGNDNGLVEYQEEIFLDQKIKNYTAFAASNVEAKLSTSDTNIVITDSIYTWSSVGANAVLHADNAFGFQVNSLIPDQHMVAFELEISDNQSNVWTSTYEIKLNAPSLHLMDAQLQELSGNGNGVVERNETARLTGTLVNQGAAEAKNVASQLISGSNLVTVDGASTKSHGNLASNASVAVEYDVSLDNALWFGSIFDLNLRASASVYQDDAIFTFMAGEAMEKFETGDFSLFNWDQGNSKPWYIDSLNPINGKYTARSYDGLNHNENSVLSINMNTMADDSIRFLYKVSSEADYDFLEFYIDNQLIGRWSGVQSQWSEAAFMVPAGQHTFTWIYSKDYGWDEGDDCAWLDDILFPPNDLFSAVDEKTAESDIAVYPNPTTDQLTVQSDRKISSVELYDLSGRLLVQEIIHNANAKLQLGSFQAGVYLLKVKTEDGMVQNKKIILKN
ncbi:MAG: C25 family cysteine peptidase [Bacteroidales bacterium]